MVEEVAALLLQVRDNPREKLLGHHQAAFEEEVKMPGLRHSSPVFAALRQLVALDDGDAVIVVGEHPRRLHAAYAAAHHHGVTAVPLTTGLPLLPPATV